MDAGTFVTDFPEFAGTDPVLVAAMLAEASGQLDPTIYGQRQDRAVYLVAADMLARSPMGNSAKLDTTTGLTVYQREFESIRTAAVLASPRW